MRYKTIWLLILLLFAGDIATTLYGLNNGYEEKNPIIKESIEKHGQLQALMIVIPFKLASMAAAIFGQLFTRDVGMEQYEIIFPVMLVLISAIPVVWNLLVLFVI